MPGRFRPVVVVLGFLAIGTAVGAALKPIRWRTQVVFLHAIGRIPDIDTRHLLAYMMPGSSQMLGALIVTRNPFEVIRNARTSSEDIRRGGAQFNTEGCAHCHGSDGSGGSGGPSLITGKFKNGPSDWAVYRTIRYGVRGSAMPPHELSDDQIWQLVSFVRYLGGSQSLAASPSSARPEIRVTARDIAAVRTTAADWLTYSGSYSSWRHSGLRQIDPTNVGRLALRWVHPDLETDVNRNEATPLVRDGTMFVSSGPARVLALDALTGKEIWRYEYKLTSDAMVQDGAPRGNQLDGWSHDVEHTTARR